MLLKMFSIRDSKAEIFNPPFFARSYGEGLRHFQTLTNDPKATVHLYPSDFDLYYIGEYDDLTGKLKSNDTPQHLEKAVVMVNEKNLQ